MSNPSASAGISHATTTRGVRRSLSVASEALPQPQETSRKSKVGKRARTPEIKVEPTGTAEGSRSLQDVDRLVYGVGDSFMLDGDYVATEELFRCLIRASATDFERDLARIRVVVKPE